MMLTSNAAPGESGAVAPAACTASLALDIGPDKGALIIYPSERFRGREIEISRCDTEVGRVHTGVHERQSGSASLLTAVFGSLEAGRYAVWEDSETTAGTVSVIAESVAEFHLP
jgi:hypothetical protein